MQNLAKFTRLLAMLMLLATLAACGGSGGVAGLSPTERVDAFLKDFVAAMSDAKITDAAKQDEWATKLASHVAPAERESSKAEFKTQLGQIADSIAQIQGASPDLKDAHFNVEVNNLELEKTSEQGDSAEVQVKNGTIKFNIAGVDQSKLPPEFAAFTGQEIPLADAGLAESGEPAKLTKVDGNWFLTDVSGADQ